MRSLLPLLVLASLQGCAFEDGFDDLEGEDEKSDSVGSHRILWRGGDVYLMPEPDIGWTIGIALDNAVAELEANTPVRVHLITDAEESATGKYIEFAGRFGFLTGGYAPLGVGGAKAEASTYSVRHEVGHIIGLDHTISRRDRDEHVVVHTAHLADGQASAYRVSTGTILGPYDRNSVMHYGSFDGTDTSCAAVTILPEGQTADPDECFSNLFGERVINSQSDYSDWNYSVMSALYCDRRYCGDRCASRDRCSAPAVKEHLQRLTDWEQTPEGQELLLRYPPRILTP